MPQPIQQLEKLYYFNVGKHGTFLTDDNPIYNTVPSEIDAIFHELELKGKKKIVLYFHGGLVPAESGLETATRVTKYVLRDTDAHPISFVWETGLKKTVLHNLDTVARSDFFKKLLIKILKVAGRKLGIETIGDWMGAKGIDQLTESEILIELNKPAPFESYHVNVGAKSANVINASALQSEQEIEASLQAEIEAEMEEEIEDDYQLKTVAASDKPADEAALMEADLTEETDGGKGIIGAVKLIAAAVKITVRVITRHIQNRDHDFYPTAVEEILREFYVADLGNWLWGSMKEKAGEMWKPSELIGDFKKWAVGDYFIKKLEAYQQKVGSLTIDVVGHSAGSIVICELLKSLSKRNSDIRFRHVMFMAPAVRCDLFVSSAFANPKLFSTFRCFTMSDDQEKKDHLVKFIYPRSLLYLISGILEKESDAHILGMQRHVSGNSPYLGPMFTQIGEFFKPSGTVVYSITEDQAGDGLRSGSISHGGFDDEGEPTMDSIMYLIKN
jgi:hypothetical protein